jgi:hypothetical protein
LGRVGKHCEAKVQGMTMGREVSIGGYKNASG